MSRLDVLTPREREVAIKIAQGCSAQEVAQALGISRQTVRLHLRACYRKLGLVRVGQLVRAVLKADPSL